MPKCTLCNLEKPEPETYYNAKNDVFVCLNCFSIGLMEKIERSKVPGLKQLREKNNTLAMVAFDATIKHCFAENKRNGESALKAKELEKTNKEVSKE